MLSLTPVLHNSGFVDIEVTQELSEAEVNETSGIDSPTIRNRSLTTIVTLRDGGSILLGGLISSTTSDNETGVPFFGAIPGVGRLFRADGENKERRELLVMIIPYVMDRPKDAEEITEQLTNAFVANSDAQITDP
jgi:general secretion pathway protein D